MKIGEYARGGKPRGDYRAADHDRGGEEKYLPFGLLDEDSGQLQVTFGSSSKTSDFIVDSLYDSTIKFFYLDRTGTCGSRHTGRCPIFQ